MGLYGFVRDGNLLIKEIFCLPRDSILDTFYLYLVLGKILKISKEILEDPKGSQSDPAAKRSKI